MSKSLKKISGFTLVELIIVISIIGILFSAGVVSYIDFNRRQIIVQSAKKIMEDLRLAQSLAANNQKPVDDSENCTTLLGYDFNFTGNNYTVNAVCSPVSPSPIKTDSVPENLTLVGFSNVRFKILRQGIEFTSSEINKKTLVISGFSKDSISKTITVGDGGDITIND